MRTPPRTLLAALAAATLALSACGGSEEPADGGATASDELRTVTVGVVPVVDVAALYVGEAQGFFADRGIELDIQFGTGGAALVPGLMNDSYDFVYANVVTLLQARDRGLPLVAVAEGGRSTGEQGADHGGVLVPEASDVQDAGDLAGRRVAVNALAGLHELTTRAAVEAAGGDPDAVSFVELPLPDMATAMAEGQVDAMATSEPFLGVAAAQGNRLVASQFVDTDPDFVTALYTTTEQKTQQDPELVEAFTAAVEESMDYAADHSDEVRAELPNFTQIDPAVIPTMVLTKFSSDLPRQPLERVAELAQKSGVLGDGAAAVDGLLSYREQS
ncbi:ABC transporter substrate-binding protein [Geodermatophilus ruber]|uniref:NitT/TauT family transport system substrate-binding protein n=1 Tax=Geodermatophilus ruber TaxID=504800 RepID=A0A1I4BNH1_9ACTN|nr:ABC transporter substrate-binding protein [Geodermatophilus ruber]SFK70328.1 NitT/TauT family transport system substrate-binding protein [Geodermatophilus ruber]